MDKNNKFWLIPILLMLIVAPFSAAGKDHKINDFCSFEGTIEKKIPVGFGTLFIGDIKNQEKSVRIEGNFEGDKIIEAVFTINKTKFYGNITYRLSSIKSNGIEITLRFNKGYFVPILSFTPSLSYMEGLANESNRINVPNNEDNYISLLFDKNNRNGAIHCIPESYSYSCEAYTKHIKPFSNVIETNQWAAYWNYNEDMKEVATSLKSGRDKFVYSKDFNLYSIPLQTELAGDVAINYVYRRDPEGFLKIVSQVTLPSPYYFTSKDNFYIKLNDGSELKRLNNNSFELKLTNGDIYNGDFANFPDNESNLLAWVLELNPSILKFNTGTLTYATGNTETIVKGERKGFEIENKLHAIPGTESLPNYHELVKTHKPIYSWTYTGKSYNDELNKLSSDLLTYIGKPNMDELDMKLYYDSDQYQKELEEYKRLRTQPFYCYEKFKNVKFTTKGFTFNPVDFGFGDETYWDELKVVRFVRKEPYFYFPFKEEYYSWPADFNINVKDFELLKLLKERQDNLCIMATFTPGIIIGKTPIVKPTGLYIFDNEAKEILLDVSYAMDKYSESLLTERYNKAQKDYEAKLKQKPPYHSETIRIMCIGCYGKGYLEDYSWGEYKINKCPLCHGRGYEDTHYYWE